MLSHCHCERKSERDSIRFLWLQSARWLGFPGGTDNYNFDIPCGSGGRLKMFASGRFWRSYATDCTSKTSRKWHVSPYHASCRHFRLHAGNFAHCRVRMTRRAAAYVPAQGVTTASHAVYDASLDPACVCACDTVTRTGAQRSASIHCQALTTCWTAERGLNRSDLSPPGYESTTTTCLHRALDRFTLHLLWMNSQLATATIVIYLNSSWHYNYGN